MTNNSTAQDYTLVVCEKPDAARRVAEALAGTGIRPVIVEGVETFEFSKANEKFVVCSAMGHLYTISDPFKRRGVYPVFDLEWYPVDLVNKELKQTKRRIDAIRKLAAGAKRFVNACDFDVEGETIGHNVLRYACAGKEDVALRAKFSTLTKDELVSAFDEAKPRTGEGLARAGRTRHFIDFLWGVNFSRALSQAILQGGHRYRTVSVGRVQGPTLFFVVKREAEIRTFVPVPYWTVRGVFQKNEERFEAPYSVDKISRMVEAESIGKACEGQEAVVSEVKRSIFRERPPLPFNTGELQKEAFRVFGFSPSRTLHVAERLYLDALISYPRTSSQKIPSSIDYWQIIQKLGRMRDYAVYSQRLLKKELRPREGEQSDSAHPSIYPTGEYPRRRLEVWEKRLFDMIVRRFLANFADDAVRERISATITVEDHRFKLSASRTIEEGWINFYEAYANLLDTSMPELNEGDLLRVVSMNREQKFYSPPYRYNQASLLEKMEREGIGTKATRAETISTLIERGYVSGNSLVATDVGFSVIETMSKYSPDIISTELTRQAEKHLERIEVCEEDGEGLVEDMMRTISSQTIALKSMEKEIGTEIGQSITATFFDQSVLGVCPVCKVGRLRVIRSSKTRKRFVGCTNYRNGCRASAPLPQKGVLKPASKTCTYCGWPVVFVRLRRAPWRLCVNVNCTGKRGRERELSTVQKTS